jgi:hypothetical protein
MGKNVALKMIVTTDFMPEQALVIQHHNRLNPGNAHHIIELQDSHLLPRRQP